MTGPVQASTPPGWEPQIVRASPASVEIPLNTGPRLVSAVTPIQRGLPVGVGSERGLQIQTIRIKRAISARFPEIVDIGGWRQDSMKWHPNGLAIDVIIPEWDTPAGKALGDRIAEYVMANAKRFKVEAIIWQQTYRPTGGTPHLMDDLGNPDANHYTHVHVATYGGGYPKGNETYFD
ncbi:MAG: hypothetical protein ACR2JM_01275 [Mycobacterium sp.]